MKKSQLFVFWFPPICERAHKSPPERKSCRCRTGPAVPWSRITCKAMCCACRGFGSFPFFRGAGHVKLQPLQEKTVSSGFCAPNCWSDLISKPLSWLGHFEDKQGKFPEMFFRFDFLFCFWKSFRPAVAGKRGKYESFGSLRLWAIWLIGSVYPEHFSFSFWISKYFITSLEMQCFEFSPFSRGPLSNLIILSNETWFYVGLFCF